MHEDLVIAATEAYLGEFEGADAARLEFMAGLWVIQREVAATVEPYEPPTAEQAREALVRGETIFQVHEPSISLANFLAALDRVIGYVAKSAGLAEEQVTALREADFSAAVTDEALTTAATAPESLVAAVADTLGVTTESALTFPTLSFVVYSALVPLLIGPSARALEALGEFDRAAWSSGRCPVCGASASMGRLGESTALQGADRALWCGMCHAEWVYDRIRCVRCGTRNPESLKYRHIEGDEAHRIHLCGECHGYTRFVFVNDLKKPLSMQVEDVVSTPLDGLALREGYTATGDGGKTAC